MARESDFQATHQATRDGLNRSRLVGAELAIVAGPDAGLQASIDFDRLIIGSGVDCDLRLGDPLVSRRHVRLQPTPRGIVIEDLSSRNGTFVLGVQIERAVLTQDATLLVGGTSISVRPRKEPDEYEFSKNTRFGDAIAHGPAMRRVFHLLEQAARTEVTVLLEGDSGTGKDVLARAIHGASARRDAPFVVFDCAATPDNLFESELFGHERGAFTGAVATRAGALEQADGGTLFLDEIGELPLETQKKLLRALESRSYRRLGGTRTSSADVRLVAATNRRLKSAVKKGEFREDLYYRLAVVHVLVPNLAERREDVLPIAEELLQRATGKSDVEIPPSLAKLLLAYHWPGNVRELRNVIERFATFDNPDAALLFAGEREPAPSGGPLDLAALEHLPYHEAKARMVECLHRVVLPRVVERANGSVTRAAELLGISKQSLYRMLQPVRDPDEDD